MAATTSDNGILVAVDGSPAARVATDWAAREVVLHRLPLKVVHVVESPAVRMWPEMAMPAAVTESLRRRGHE